MQNKRIEMKNFLFVTGFVFMLSQAVMAQDISSLVAEATSEAMAEENTAETEAVNSFEDENIPAVGLTIVDNTQASEQTQNADDEDQVVEEEQDIEDDEDDDPSFLFEDEYEQETKVNPNRSLTENLTGNVKKEKKSAKKSEEAEDAPAQNNWMDKLITANSKKGTSAGKSRSLLGNLVEESKTNVGRSRSNAAVFDISGIMLRMTLAQADAAMQKHGYRKISQKLEIPNFIKWRNEELCRGAGVVGYERLGNCVKQKAQKDKYEYVESVKYSKFDTKETMEIHLTSTFTGNKIYKVIYKSESALIRGSSQKAAYLRNIKIYDFWKKINQKYGAPDNRDDVLWGLGGNKPYMHAKTGFLLLEDPMLRELDYTRMSREDQRFINTDIYTF